MFCEKDVLGKMNESACKSIKFSYSCVEEALEPHLSPCQVKRLFVPNLGVEGKPQTQKNSLSVFFGVHCWSQKKGGWKERRNVNGLPEKRRTGFTFYWATFFSLEYNYCLTVHGTMCLWEQSSLSFGKEQNCDELNLKVEKKKKKKKNIFWRGGRGFGWSSWKNDFIRMTKAMWALTVACCAHNDPNNAETERVIFCLVKSPFVTEGQVLADLKNKRRILSFIFFFYFEISKACVWKLFCLIIFIFFFIFFLVF